MENLQTQIKKKKIVFQNISKIKLQTINILFINMTSNLTK